MLNDQINPVLAEQRLEELHRQAEQQRLVDTAQSDAKARNGLDIFNLLRRWSSQFRLGRS